MTIATTDQKARMFDLTTAISELFRDGNRDAEPVLGVLQFMKDQRDGAERLLTGLRQVSQQEPTTPTINTAPPAPKPIIATYPIVGEIFELTLDGDAPENDPIEMARRDGYAEPEKWRYTGAKVAGLQTRRFKLVEIGHCRSFDEVKRKIAKHGEIPSGQWREAFKAKYSRPDGKGPVGVPDASWVNPSSNARFPCVHTIGESSFSWTDNSWNDGWRWLVEVRK